ncbi:MAG: hypothetical protein KAS23_14040, partial [Anaerohalosphaera sp.]|nr:hypothetical protein [Anaerohalosphaera sp.]
MKKLLYLVMAFVAMACCWQSTALADSPVTDGLVKHLDASAITGLSDGDPVDVWEDLAGYDDMIPYAGVPTYVTGVINGEPVVRFDATGGMTATTTETHFSGNAAHTVFVVSIANSFSDKSLWQIGENGSALYSAFNLEGDTSIGCRMGNGYNKFVPGTAHVLGNTELFVISHQGGTHTYSSYALDISGVAAANATNNAGNKLNMAASTIRVGNRDNGGTSFDGDIAELLVFNRYLSIEEMNQVGLYLANKYGLTTSYTDKVLVHNQSPANGALVGQLLELSWEVALAQGTPTFKVFIGNEPNEVTPGTPEFIATPVATTQDTSVALAVLDPGTTYYWTVEVTDDSDTTVGEILSFTTSGNIAGLYPADGQADIAKDTMVTWTAEPAGATYITGYEVYFGETLPGTPNATITENQWQAPPLVDNTSYQVKVVSLHEGTPVDEATSTFTVGTLVGYWLFDGDLLDTVGDNDGTTKTGSDPNFREGVIGGGQAVDFEGALADNYVIIPTAALEPKGNWTISCWERSYAAGGGWESFMGCGTDGHGWGTFEFGRLYGHRYVFGLNQGGGYYYTPDNSSFPREVWHYHAISHDAQKRKIEWYINGALAHTFTGTNVTLAPDLTVGNVKSTTSAQPYNGMIDDFKLYNRPVSLDEVITEYVNGTGGAPILPGPASGTPGVMWDVVLEWTASGDTTAQVLEIGKEP